MVLLSTFEVHDTFNTSYAVVCLEERHSPKLNLPLLAAPDAFLKCELQTKSLKMREWPQGTDFVKFNRHLELSLPARHLPFSSPTLEDSKQAVALKVFRLF